jgi:hypothetical protein
MKYKPELGIIGNIKLLFTERNKTNNNVFNNKATADANHEESIEGLCEIAEIASDETDASTELAEMVAELYEAVAELGDIVASKEV